MIENTFILEHTHADVQQTLNLILHRYMNYYKNYNDSSENVKCREINFCRMC